MFAELAGRVRLLIGRVPAVLVIAAALGGSWLLHRAEQAARSSAPTRVVAVKRAGRVAWVVGPGQRVSRGDVVARLVDQDVEGMLCSPVDGSVRAVLKDLGDLAVAGEPIVIVGTLPE